MLNELIIKWRKNMKLMSLKNLLTSVSAVDSTDVASNIDLLAQVDQISKLLKAAEDSLKKNLTELAGLSDTVAKTILQSPTNKVSVTKSQDSWVLDSEKIKTFCKEKKKDIKEFQKLRKGYISVRLMKE